MREVIRRTGTGRRPDRWTIRRPLRPQPFNVRRDRECGGEVLPQPIRRDAGRRFVRTMTTAHVAAVVVVVGRISGLEARKRGLGVLYGLGGRIAVPVRVSMRVVMAVVAVRMHVMAHGLDRIARHTDRISSQQNGRARERGQHQDEQPAERHGPSLAVARR